MATTPLTETARHELLERIEKRKKELAEKRQKYAALTGAEIAPVPPPPLDNLGVAPGFPSPSALVNDVVSAAATAAQEAARSVFHHESSALETPVCHFYIF